MTNTLDQFRIIIEEGRTGDIVARDMKVENLKMARVLSGPCTIEFDVDFRDPSVQMPDGSGPILFKPWGHLCHIETLVQETGQKAIFATGIFQPSEVDPATGKLHATFKGFSSYAKGIPMLFNWNPIATDPFSLVYKIWQHIQSYSNGNLGVTVYSLDFYDGVTKVVPPTSGTQMLPGFSYDGTAFVLDFFAVFIRAVDYTDAGDYINKLSSDIPFDYFEESRWSDSGDAIEKYLQLAYPHGGVYQENLTFRQGENIVDMKTRTESEIEWASDIVGRGWFPGKTYSSTISNADPTRFRRVVMETDVNVNSTERSEMWGHRQLTRRQWPHYWESIIIEQYHSNAPWGSYDVGDQIRVQAFMPWVGEVDQVHKIIAISIDENTAKVELTLRAEGAFNYDPLFFDGEEINLLSNPGFTNNLDSWTQVSGVWSRDAGVGNLVPGSAHVAANGTEKELRSEAITIDNADDWIEVSCAVFWEDGTIPGVGITTTPIRIVAYGYNISDVQIGTAVVDTILNPVGTADDWQPLAGRWWLPNGVTTVKASLIVQSTMTGGDVWFDDVRINKDD